MKPVKIMTLLRAVCTLSLLVAASLTAQQQQGPQHQQTVPVVPGAEKTAGFAAQEPGITFKLDVTTSDPHKFQTGGHNGILGENRDSTFWWLDYDSEKLKTYKVLVNRTDDPHEAVFKMRFKPEAAVIRGGGGGGYSPKSPPPAYVKAVNCFVKIHTPGTIAAPGTFIPTPSVAGKPYTGILQPNTDDEIIAGTEDHASATKTGDGLTKDSDLVKVELSWNPVALRPDMVKGKVLQVVLPTNTKAYLESGVQVTDLIVPIGSGAAGKQLAALGGDARKQNIFIEGNAAWTAGLLIPDVTLKVTGLDYHGAEAKALLLPVKIVPDAGQRGKTGDQVPSNRAVAGQKYYVSPKKSEEIPDDFVVLKAEGVEQELFDNLMDWVCIPDANGSKVADNSMKFHVKRNATAKTTVKIVDKIKGTEVDRMNVWVVWSEGVKVKEHPIATIKGQVQTGDGTVGPGMRIDGGYNFKFMIQPLTIFTESDHPELSGANTYNGNFIDPPGSGTLHCVSNSDIKGGADKKWDVSRRVKIKIINPQLYPVTKLSKIAGNLLDNQPLAEDIPVLYPSDITIGNDDTSSLDDEDNNPYEKCELPNAIHEVGEIASTDRPSALMRNSTGIDGDKFEDRYHFGEFTRLLVGDKWYVTSEMFDWRMHVKFIRITGAWEDDGSFIATDNTGF